MSPRMLRLVCACACLIGVFMLASATRAQATAEQKAAAEALFEEGMSLIKKGNFADACPKFELSQRIDPAVGTMLYLAECYEKTNRTASSWAMFREAASLAEASGQTDRMKTAQARAARLEPRLAWLNIELAPGALVPGLEIKRNGTVVTNDLAGTPTPVDPGEVVVEASAPGRVPYSTKVSVAPKARLVVTVPELAALPAAAVAAAAPPPAPPAQAPPAAVKEPEPQAPPAPASSTGGGRSVVPWVVGGVGIVALGVGTVFGLKAMSDADQAREICPDGFCNDAEGPELVDDAETAATVSNISFAVGAACVVTGVVLYFTLPSKSGSQVGLVPTVDRSSLGLTLRGRLAL